VLLVLRGCVVAMIALVVVVVVHSAAWWWWRKTKGGGGDGTKRACVCNSYLEEKSTWVNLRRTHSPTYVAGRVKIADGAASGQDSRQLVMVMVLMVGQLR
jgi:hypothetical protein